MFLETFFVQIAQSSFLDFSRITVRPPIYSLLQPFSLGLLVRISHVFCANCKKRKSYKVVTKDYIVVFIGISSEKNEQLPQDFFKKRLVHQDFPMFVHLFSPCPFVKESVEIFFSWGIRFLVIFSSYLIPKIENKFLVFNFVSTTGGKPFQNSVCFSLYYN